MKKEKYEIDGGEPFYIAAMGVLTAYFICCIIEWDLNPGNWNMYVRITGVLWAIFFSAFFIYWFYKEVTE